ncbi:hypothetical protein Trydic_g6579 [Trypoxylus dichotomus]
MLDISAMNACILRKLSKPATRIAFKKRSSFLITFEKEPAEYKVRKKGQEVESSANTESTRKKKRMPKLRELTEAERVQVILLSSQTLKTLEPTELNEEVGQNASAREKQILERSSLRNRIKSSKDLSSELLDAI